MKNIDLPKSKVVLIPFSKTFIVPYGQAVLLPDDFIQSIDTFSAQRNTPDRLPLSHRGYDVKIMWKEKNNRVFEESERLAKVCAETERLVWYFSSELFLRNLQDVFNGNHQEFATLFLDPITMEFSHKAGNCYFSLREQTGGSYCVLKPMRAENFENRLLVCYS